MWQHVFLICANLFTWSLNVFRYQPFKTNSIPSSYWFRLIFVFIYHNDGRCYTTIFLSYSPGHWNKILGHIHYLLILMMAFVKIYFRASDILMSSVKVSASSLFSIPTSYYFALPCPLHIFFSVILLIHALHNSLKSVSISFSHLAFSTLPFFIVIF